MQHDTTANRRRFLAESLAATALSAVGCLPRLNAANVLNSADAKAKFKLGLVSYNVSANWDLKTTLDICRRVGLAALECRTTHKHLVEPNLTAEQRKDVKKQFADSGVLFWGSGSICEFHSDDKKVVEKNIEDCKKFVGLVAELGGQGVKVRPNGVAKGMTTEQACEQIGKALIPCGQAAKDAGIEIWVEVHGNTTQEPKNMKLIMAACGHESVGVTWNSNDGEVENQSIAANFELLAKHIRSCHINDLGKQKTGKYPYVELFKKLHSIGYDRYTLIEIGKTYEPKEGEEFLKSYKATWDEFVSQV